MSKVVWVLLPLLLVVATLAAMAWQQRMPQRGALNVLFSLLLLAYVLTTASWGVFWVANQQSPVRAGAWSIATLGALLWHVNGLVAGMWHYEPEQHRLARLRPDLPALDAWLGSAVPANAAACIVATAVFGRSGHKYRDRTYRYVLADLGHALANLRLAADALGGSARLLTQFDEALIDADLQLTPQDKSTLAVAVLATGVLNNDHASGTWQPATLAADDATPLALTAAVHRATSLRLVRGQAAAPRNVPPP